MLPPVASKFIAGESPEAALNHTQSMNQDEIGVILNLLGEHYDDPEPAKADANTYIDLISEIDRQDLMACISVKPSQIGIDISGDLFAENLRQIVANAHEHDVFVWCDMEDADTTDVTLNTFVELANEYPWTVGQCVQANLKRTSDDLARIIDVPGKIRLVKGAYDEPSSIAYTEKAQVNEEYKKGLEYLFSQREQGIAVGTHDPEMIELARSLGAEYDAQYEVQMLMGVRGDAQGRLAAEDISVWQYAPYGNKWISYFYRRVRERKENALFAARAVLGI